MSFDKNMVYQVLDWTHAKQNLQEIVKLVAPAKQAVMAGKWEYLLWEGLIDSLGKSIEETVTGKANHKQAMKKLVLSLSKYSLTILRRTASECSTRLSKNWDCLVAAAMWNLC